MKKISSLLMTRLFSVSLLFGLGAAVAETPQRDAPIALAIHGGAGTIKQQQFSVEQRLAYEAKLNEALQAGYNILHKGGTSLDAITASIKVLEDSPFFNAGKGAVYTYSGEHELDASIMDGRTLQAGAVSGVKQIENPIELARLVMDKSVHVMLSGAGAEAFAQSQGMKLIDNSIFNTPRRHQQLIKAKQKLTYSLASDQDRRVAYAQLEPSFKMGTVGAVALDKAGNLAAGTSTGGMTAKRFGRIGDSPIIGAGTYADNQSCAVSATGHGEFFIRYNVAADICARVKYQGKSIDQAGQEVIFGPMFEAGGTGGVIIVDKQGQISMPFNTAGMYRGSISSHSPAKVKIFKEK